MAFSEIRLMFSIILFLLYMYVLYKIYFLLVCDEKKKFGNTKIKFIRLLGKVGHLID